MAQAMTYFKNHLVPALQAFRRVFCKAKLHQWVSIAHGYPARQETWVDVYVCKHCVRRKIVRDDLFAESRSEVMGHYSRKTSLIVESTPGVLKRFNINL